MSTSVPKPARLLMRYGRDVILERFRRDSCIASTAIGIKVLHRFGIKAWPVPARVTVFNQTYIKMMETFEDGHEPTDEEKQYWLDAGAWSVDVEGRENLGHVVIGTQKHIIDLSIDQASRPHKNINLEPLSVETPDYFYDGDIVYTDLHGSLVVYHYEPDWDAYLNSPNWLDDTQHDDLVDRIERIIRRRTKQER